LVADEELELVLDDDVAAGVEDGVEVVDGELSGFLAAESPDPPDFSALTLPERESLR
jgi:hypothetical protein